MWAKSIASSEGVETVRPLIIVDVGSKYQTTRTIVKKLLQVHPLRLETKDDPQNRNPINAVKRQLQDDITAFCDRYNNPAYGRCYLAQGVNALYDPLVYANPVQQQEYDRIRASLFQGI